MRTFKKIVSAVCLALDLAVSSRAAVVHLKNGGRMEGTVVSATARDVELYTVQGTVHVNADQIQSIDYGESEPVPEPRPAPRAEPRYYAPASLSELFTFDFGFASPLSRIGPIPGGASARNGGTGVQLGVQYLHALSSRLSAGVNVDYFSRVARDDFGFVPSADTNISGGAFMTLGVLKYFLAPRGPVRPYVLGGLGVNHTSMLIEAQPLLGFSWSDTGTDEVRTLSDDDRWGLASTARVGVEFPLVESSVIGFELGWTGLANGRYSATPAGQDLGLDGVTGRLSALNTSLRWGWRF